LIGSGRAEGDTRVEARRIDRFSVVGEEFS
jgi:hypothetical protein